MTPKEKAEELFDKMCQYPMWKEQAIQCALIAVDEIINTESLANRICGYTKLTKEHLQYWQEVKIEIEKL
jgi:hypothetical protein